MHGKEATVSYVQIGAAQRYADAGILRLDVLPSPEDSSRQDPNVALSGTIVLPEGAPGTIDAHLHGGIDRTTSVDGSTVHFSSEAPIWQPMHEVDVAFPADRLPGRQTRRRSRSSTRSAPSRRRATNRTSRPNRR